MIEVLEMRLCVNAFLALLVLATAARGETVLELGKAEAPRSPDLSSLPEPARAELVGAGLVETSVRLTGEGHPGALDVNLRFDPAFLAFVDASADPNAKNAMLQARESEPGALALSLVSADGFSPGTLFRVRFRILGEGASTALTASATAYDADSLAEIPLRVEPGEITATETKLSKLSMESKILILVFPALAGVFLLIGGVRYARRLRGA